MTLLLKAREEVQSRQTVQIESKREEAARELSRQNDAKNDDAHRPRGRPVAWGVYRKCGKFPTAWRHRIAADADFRSPPNATDKNPWGSVGEISANADFSQSLA